ncbi:MAG: hypothetical protein JXA41_15460 [Deltaproteobacteria bacterium]|nr:hypothetical protein [Deltaproteobacteria bacterium]
MEKLTKVSGIYALISAVSMVMVWSLLIGFDFLQDEMRAHPLRYYFLAAAELITACMLFISGVGLLKKSERILKLFYISMGMMLYAVILATGEFLSIGLPWFAALFAVVAIATAAILGIHLMKNQ